MHNTKVTQVPNIVFDIMLAQLTELELKVLLIVIRQTFGWVDRKSGGRKQRDRISGSQFRSKTGLSKRVITNAIARLSKKGLIIISDYNGAKLSEASERKGRTYLYYSASLPAHLATSSKVQLIPSPKHNPHNNKTKRKESGQRPQRDFCGHVAQLVVKRDYEGMSRGG